MKEDYHKVSFKSSGRYSVLGTLDSNTKHLVFVLHGQGQLAKYFIRKFKPLLALGYVIIAPEGLHTYYLEGFTGRVGAGWMTSENRLASINNYINFLNATVAQIQESLTSNIPIHILGFSQGTATASRWVAQSNFNFENLTLWGGALPPDLDQTSIFERMKNKKLTHLIGNKDQYIDKANVEKIKSLARNYGLDSDYIMYDGGHDIDTLTLLDLFKNA